jgi:hypothetical protein
MVKLIMNHNDYIFVDAQFFFAPLNEDEGLGKAISISYIDKFPSFEHKTEILKNFETNGLILLDYEITYRPIKANDDLKDYEITRH